MPIHMRMASAHCASQSMNVKILELINWTVFVVIIEQMKNVCVCVSLYMYVWLCQSVFNTVIIFVSVQCYFKLKIISNEIYFFLLSALFRWMFFCFYFCLTFDKFNGLNNGGVHFSFVWWFAIATGWLFL